MRRLTTLCVSLMLLTATLSAGELEIGATAPGFSLINAVDGRYGKYDPNKGSLAVVVFTCNQCPYARAFEQRLIDLGRRYGEKGVAFYAVNPNDESKYPEESIEHMKERATGKGYPFPYLKDTDSSVARSYGARVTPHVFVMDGAGKVRYRGYVDDSARVEERGHTGLADALDSLLGRKEIARTTTKAFGCSIKWKTGA